MIKYKYTIENQTIECLNISEVPDGLNYETITFEQEFEVTEEPTLPIANEIVIDLLTKQVETMTEEEKTDILQTLLTQ
jgi:hypothetical protein